MHRLYDVHTQHYSSQYTPYSAKSDVHDDHGGDHLLSTVIVISVMSTRCHSLSAKLHAQHQDEGRTVVSWQMLRQSGRIQMSSAPKYVL